MRRRANFLVSQDVTNLQQVKQAITLRISKLCPGPVLSVVSQISIPKTHNLSRWPRAQVSFRL